MRQVNIFFKILFSKRGKHFLSFNQGPSIHMTQLDFFIAIFYQVSDVVYGPLLLSFGVIICYPKFYPSSFILLPNFTRKSQDCKDDPNNTSFVLVFQIFGGHAIASCIFTPYIPLPYNQYMQASLMLCLNVQKK